MLLGVFPGPKLVTSRLLHSFFTFPTTHSLRDVALCAIVLDAAVLGLGVTSGLYRWQPLPSARALGWSAAYLMMRTVLEEIVFRGMLLPHPKADGKLSLASPTFWLQAIIPTAAFVLSHLWTTQRQPNTVLKDTKFLATLSLVGMACVWAYWQSGGGMWAAMFMHFALVYPWMTLLGGFKKTHTPTTLKPRMAPTGTIAAEPTGAKLD